MTQRTLHPFLRRLGRKNVLAGLMFIAIAVLGLWLAREYPVGTLRRMSTGFMPQLLCWLLMGLGSFVLVQGLLERDRAAAADEIEQGAAVVGGGGRENYWSIVFVAASLVAFALTIERLGLIVAIVLLVAIASFAYRGLKWWETLLSAVVLVVLCWAVFVLGLGMAARMLPEFSSVIPERPGTSAELGASSSHWAGANVSLTMLASPGMTGSEGSA